MNLTRVTSFLKSFPAQCSFSWKLGVVSTNCGRCYMSNISSEGGESLVSLKESKRFIMDCMAATGAPKKNAEAFAEILVQADYRGVYNQGLYHLELYINDVKSKICNPSATPKILKQNKATAWVDGQNGLGVVIGNFCMDLAIKKAKDVGVGWVTCKGSNHHGMTSMYPLQAIKKGLIGLSFTNTSPFMCPTRSKEIVLGTNPISIAAPAGDGDNFVLDMTTTTVDYLKIEKYMRKNKPIPEGWAQDAEGNITTDSKLAYEARCLMPLGGSEINSGYNGYGLSVAVEVFCGILAGAHYGATIRTWGDVTEVADLAQCFIAIDPNRFAPKFECRLAKFLCEIREMEPTDPEKPVLVAGDLEKRHMETVDKAGGVCYAKDLMKVCQQLSESLKVKPLKPVS